MRCSQSFPQGARWLVALLALVSALLTGCAERYRQIEPPPEFLSLDNEVIAIEGGKRDAHVRLRLDRLDPPLNKADELKVMRFDPRGLTPIPFQRQGTLLSFELTAGATALIYPLPTGLLRDNYLALCRVGNVLQPHHVPLLRDRLCPVILCASNSLPAAAWLQRFAELAPLFAAAGLEDLQLGGFGPGMGPGGVCERCTGQLPPFINPECVRPPPQTLPCTVEIADRDGTVLTSPVVTEQVGVRTELQVLVTPVPTAGTAFSWSVGGEAIARYDHDIDEPGEHARHALQNDDLDDQRVSFFWRDDAEDVEVSIAVVTPFGATCRDSETFAVDRSADINFTVYAEDSDDDRTPSYNLLEGHGGWHLFELVDGEVPPHSGPEDYWGDLDVGTELYNGSAFLDWHRAFIDAHLAWRDTFHGGGFIGPNPSPGAPPLPNYLERVPSSDDDPRSWYYGYVRLGEYQDVDELGRDVVDPWHNSGHGLIGMATGFTRMFGFDSPGSEEDTFWKWHALVDAPRSDWHLGGGADQARIVGTIPANGETHAGALTEIVIAFDLPVSSDPTSLNEIHIRPEHLTVNGEAATAMTDVSTGMTRSMIYRFTGFAPPAAGPVTVELTGTASYAGTTFTFTVSP